MRSSRGSRQIGAPSGASGDIGAGSVRQGERYSHPVPRPPLSLNSAVASNNLPAVHRVDTGIPRIAPGESSTPSVPFRQALRGTRGSFHEGAARGDTQDVTAFSPMRRQQSRDPVERGFFRSSRGASRSVPGVYGPPAMPSTEGASQSSASVAAGRGARAAAPGVERATASSRTRADAPPSAAASGRNAVPGGSTNVLGSSSLHTTLTFSRPGGGGVLAAEVNGGSRRLDRPAGSQAHTARGRVSLSSEPAGTPPRQPLRGDAFFRHPVDEGSRRNSDNSQRRGSRLSAPNPSGGRQQRPSRASGTAERGSAGPRSSYAEGTPGSPLLEALFGETIATRLHRSFAARMFRSFFSPETPPPATLLREPVAEEQTNFSGASTAPVHHHHGASWLIPRGSHAIIAVLAQSGSGSNYLEELEDDLGLIMAQLEHRFGFDDQEEFDNPLFFLLGGRHLGAGDFYQHLPEGTNEVPPPAERVIEARSLRSSLERHTIKWTYSGSGTESTSADKARPDTSRMPSASASGEVEKEDKAEASTKPTFTGGGAVGSGSLRMPPERNGKDCCICLTSFEEGDSLLTLRCLHIFHADCLDRWIKTSSNVKCPLCSTQIAES